MTIATSSAVKQLGRILVTLDPTSGSLSGLDTMAEVAAVIGAELEAILVEDEDLLRAAELPFIQEVTWSGEVSEPFVGERLRREFSGFAWRARRALDDCRTRWQVQSHFRSIRGRLAQEVIRASAESPYLAVGVRARLSAHVGGRVSIPLRPAVERRSAGAVAPIAARVVVVADETDAGRAAVRLAAAVARRGDYDLLLLAPSEVAVRALAEAAGLELSLPGLQCRVVETLDPAVLCRVVGTDGVRLAVVAADRIAGDHERLEAICAGIDAPLLITRSG